jgi:two-component system phosphate regulon sensor histidine kinase PhoR
MPNTEESSTNTKHVPVWEQVLRRLATHPHDAASVLQPLLALIEQSTDTEVDTGRFWQRLPALLADFLPPSLVIILQETSPLTILSSNVGRQSEQAIARFIPSHPRLRSTAKLYRLPGALTIGRQTYSYVIGTVWPSEAGQIRCIALTATIPAPEQLASLRASWSMIGLRHNLNQQNRLLLQAQERFGSITQHLSEGMMVIDSQMRITVWNRPLQHLTSLSPSAVLGQVYNTALARVDQPKWLEALIDQHQNTTQSVFSTEFQTMVAQNQPKWISVSGSFLRNDSGQIEQTILIVRDISASKEVEQRKSEFISIATHELRTPITAISGYLSLVNHDTDRFSEKQRLYIERATQASQRLARLAEDLLRVTQLEENRTQFDRRVVHLGPLLKKLVSDFGEKARLKNISLALETETRRSIMADPERLGQALANLIDNAIKYTASGTVTVQQRFIAEQNNHPAAVEIRITDTGRGISIKEQEVIFDKFRRGASASLSRESGAGLGLFIVKSFIEKQGGTIKVRSKPNRGTTFTLQFPAIPEKTHGKKTHPSR